MLAISTLSASASGLDIGIGFVASSQSQSVLQRIEEIRPSDVEGFRLKEPVSEPCILLVVYENKTSGTGFWGVIEVQIARTIRYELPVPFCSPGESGYIVVSSLRGGVSMAQIQLVQSHVKQKLKRKASAPRTEVRK